MNSLVEPVSVWRKMLQSLRLAYFLYHIKVPYILILHVNTETYTDQAICFVRQFDFLLEKNDSKRVHILIWRSTTSDVIMSYASFRNPCILCARDTDLQYVSTIL